MREGDSTRPLSLSTTRMPRDVGVCCSCCVGCGSDGKYSVLVCSLDWNCVCEADVPYLGDVFAVEKLISGISVLCCVLPMTSHKREFGQVCVVDNLHHFLMCRGWRPF